jgi:hypothetical protein
MTRCRALLLVNLAAMLVTTVAFVGLAALHAGAIEFFFAMISPLMAASHLGSRIVGHYGASGRSHSRRPR